MTLDFGSLHTTHISLWRKYEQDGGEVRWHAMGRDGGDGCDAVLMGGGILLHVLLRLPALNLPRFFPDSSLSSLIKKAGMQGIYLP